MKRTWESYQQFLANTYSKSKVDGKFLSLDSYKAYGKKIVETLNITEVSFLNADLKQLRIWAIQIQDKPLYRTFSKKDKSNLGSGFNAFITFCRYQAGYISY